MKRKNVYVDFESDFTADKSGKIYLRISCDTNYTVWINDRVAAFAACSDYPQNRTYDLVDITKYCGEKNRIAITVWHYGKDSQTYINADAFLLFDIRQGAKTLLKSDKSIRSRVNTAYKNGYRKTITSQLGYSFLYNASAKKGEFTSSEETGVGTARRRGIKICALKKRIKSSVLKNRDGYLIDMGKEVAGFLDLDFKSEKKQKLTISYGEHLENGNVCRKIGDRDFSVEYIAKRGENTYLNTFRRLAGRYLFIESESEISISYAGIRPVQYPAKQTGARWKDALRQKIYDVGVYTLLCCMHEHYEDCPWREQALYTMDSRNQMLCGYFSFRGSAYQRENILLISEGVRKDGLLSICFPGGIDYPIPFFSLAYVMQVSEYLEYTKDVSILKKIRPAIDGIMSVFTSRVEENGLIADFEAPCWNFYEWTDGSYNEWQIGRKKSESCEKQYDLLLNCFYIAACDYYAKITGIRIPVQKTAEGVKNTFFNEARNSFRLSTATPEKYSQLGNAMAILAGVADETVAETTIRDKSLIRISLSMNTFYYDALLKTNPNYKNFILSDIQEKYGRMLEAGATTFWETENGGADFEGAGSLCHGWSAMPVYYYHLLNGKEYFNGSL